MENDENSHTDNSTTYHNDAKRGLPKLKCPWAMSNAELLCHDYEITERL